MGDDIDTDIIMPTEYLALPSVEDMKPYAFSPLRPELAGMLEPGDCIVAGKNFGCGSSREQAPEVIKALGIRCIVAKSFARIFTEMPSTLACQWWSAGSCTMRWRPARRWLWICRQVR